VTDVTELSFSCDARHSERAEIAARLAGLVIAAALVLVVALFG
jgi:hypothetical protein